MGLWERRQVMIVQRLTYRIVPGTVENLVAMLREEQGRSEDPRSMRIYNCMFGPADTVVLELEFEDMSDIVPFWDAWFAEPTTPAFMEKWNQLVTETVSNEIWEPY
jgi:hypothetical protein